MSTEVGISLTVNGERISRRVEARRHLIDFLRLDLGLMGSHTVASTACAAPARCASTD
jgi:carbon-monoxide dehydrogenase small subunit